MNSKIFSGALRALIVISMLSGIFPTTSFVSADTSTSSQAPDPSSSDAIDFDYDEDIAALDNDIVPKKKRLKLSSAADDPQSPLNNWIGVPESNTGTIKFIRKKGKLLEYRKLSKQKMYGYDTFQGACSTGKNNFYVLYDRVKQKCRIIKVNAKSYKVVKVSKPLPLDHGNDLAYDSRQKRILCIHYGRNPRRISIINPKTLKLVKHVTVPKPDESIPGASDNFIRSIKGYTGIGYDSVHNEYIVSIQGARHYMALSCHFKPLRVIEVPKLDPYMRQGMTVKSGFIIRSLSPYNRTYNQNILQVFDMAGNFVKTVKLGRGYEIESIYFIGKKLFANTYRSYWKAKYKKVYKLVNGKRKKVKVKYYALRRDNNLIRIRNY